MELLAELTELDIGLKGEGSTSDLKLQIRKASRAVVINESNKIALLFVSKKNYHKLPGGGIEQNENVYEALVREVYEEVGAEIKVILDVGVIIEYRDQHELMQVSYCYLASLENMLEAPSLTEEEQSNGFMLKWVPIEEAILLVHNDKPEDYVGRFIQKRDFTFLTKARELI